MDYFFYSALVSFFLFAPFLRSRLICNFLPKWVLQVLIGIAILLLIVGLGLCVVPEYFQRGTIIGPTETVRILLGLYFGCICRLVWNYFAEKPEELFHGLSKSDQQGWKGLISKVGSWPALGLISIFLVALMVPHLDRSLVGLNWLKIGDLEIGFERVNTETLAASEEIVLQEDRISYSENVIDFVHNLPDIVEHDRAMYGLIRHEIMGTESRSWLKDEYVNNNSKAMFDQSKAFLQKIFVPYAKCVNRIFVTMRASKERVSAAVHPVSLILRKFLSSDLINVDEVVSALNTSIQTLRQLAIFETKVCSVEFNNSSVEELNDVKFASNIRASYYVYLCTSYLLIFQDNLVGAIYFLDQHRDKFEGESNYGYARAEVSYLSAEPPDDTVRLMKKSVDDAQHTLEVMNREHKRRIKEEENVSHEWITTYKEQRDRLSQRIRRVENGAVYEVVRSLASGHDLEDMWKSIGELYLHELEEFLDSSGARSKQEKLDRMNYLDTVGFGTFVFGLYNIVLDDRRARKALGYLREAEQLAHDLKRADEVRRIQQHRRFATRILVRAG